MADSSATSRLKVAIGSETKDAENALIDLRDRFNEVRKAASQGVPLPNLKLLETQVKAGIRPLQDLKRALAETIGQAKLANKVDPNPINDQRIAEAVVKLKSLRQELTTIPPAAEATAVSLQSVGSAIKNALLPLATATAGLVFALQQATVAGQSFENQMRLVSTISKQSGPELQKLGDNILRASDALQSDAVELAAAQYEILSSGITNTSEAFDVMTESAKLAKAGVGTAAESADLLTSSLNALGGTPKRNAEILFKTVDLGKVKIGEMAQEFGGVAAQASIAGVSLEEISASVATLSLTGRNASEGLTGIRSILTAVSKQAPDAVKFAKQIGLEFNTAAIRAKGFSGFIADVAAKTKGSDEAIAKLFGRVEGINTVLSLGTVQAKQYADVLDQVKNSTGDLDQAFQRTLNPLDGFLNSLKNVVITVGEQLTNALAGPLGELQKFTDYLQQNKDLLAFTTGVAAAAAALGILATAASGILVVLTPIGIALGLLATTLGVGLAPVVGVIVASISLLLITGGALVLWANKVNNATQQASRSIADLNREMKDATDAQIKATKEYQAAASRIDDLRKKTTLSKNENLVLQDSIANLREHFSKYGIDLDSLVQKFGDYTKAVREARIQQVAFQRESDLKKQLQDVQNARKVIGPALDVAGGFGAFAVPNEQKQKQRAALLQQEEKFKNDLKRVNEDVRREFALQDAKDAEAAKNNKNNPGTQPFVDPDAAEKAVKARQDLAEKIAKIEVDITALTKGEFAKRRAEAEKNYKADVRDIEDLGKKAGVTQATITAAIKEADQRRKEQLSQIAQDEARAFRDADRFITQVRANIEALGAAITQGNPFDDIAADAKKATTAIRIEYQQAVEQLQQKLQAGSITQDQFDQTKAALHQESLLKISEARKTEADKNQDALNALAALQRDTLAIRAEIAGKEVEIEKAKNAKIIADFDAQIEKTQTLLAAARLQANVTPTDAAKMGVEQLQAELANTQAQREKALSESAKTQANIEAGQIQIVIEKVQNEIDLYGKRPQLVKELIGSYDDYIKQLETERDITGQTETRRAELNKEITSTRLEQAKLISSQSNVGKFAQALQNINLPNPEFDSFFKNVGSGLETLSVKYQQFKQENAGTLKDFLKNNQQFKEIASQLGSQTVQLIGNQITKKMVGAKKAIGTAITGALAGAIAGIPGGPVGVAVGALAGAVGGAAAGSGGKFDAKAGAKYLAFGLVGFALGGFIGGAKKAAEQQAKIDRTQKFVDQILGQADANNLQDLQSKLDQILKFKSGGGSAFKIKAQAAVQLQQAIDNRKKVIDEALNQLTLQNDAIQKQLQIFDDEPIKALDIQRSVQLSQLEAETKKALDQFKDSLAVQQKIQENFELQRQALLKSSAEDVIKTVIDEQNNIRSLRAQALVDAAQASGDSIALINAQLQAELVRIDNEVAAFQGAEEAKTAFLAAKSAERDRIIKQSQDQLNSLMKQGLDILNEGLVIGETKFDSQSRRLRDLFGSNLNPFGLLQASSDLLQKNITIASGGIQFILEGIQDAQSLLAQLDDPVIKAKLLDLLNNALARA